MFLNGGRRESPGLGGSEKVPGRGGTRGVESERPTDAWNHG